MSQASAAQKRRIADWIRRGESRRVVGTVATGVDQQSGSSQDVRAATRCVTLWAIPVPGIEIVQDAGPVQPVMDQRVDYDQLGARRLPKGIAGPSAEQEHDERQRQDLVGDAVDMPQRVDDRGSIGFVGLD